MVIKKAKELKNKLLPGSHKDLINAESLRPAREYVDAYWEKIIRSHPKDDGSLIGVPKPYLVPSYAEGHEFDYDELFYWDSYFMIQSMLGDPKRKELVMGILEDLIFIFKRYKIIPNSSQTYMTSRSQPPFLTSLILDIYNSYNPGKKWLRENIDVAKEEYETVWMGDRKPNARQVYRGLSRYYDFNYLNDIAETESGWDMTPRFGRKCLEYLPVDLNALLYKYEKDFAYVARLFNEESEAKSWDRHAEHRKHTMKALMWSDLRGLYYDYRYTKETRGSVESLATYFPMWAGMATPKQAEKLVGSLRKFEKKGGVSTTSAMQIGQYVPGALPTQWAYPNGWAPLHFIVVRGLENYGYHEDAKRIAQKWLKTNQDWFDKHGVFLEKYNVVQPDNPPARGVYPSQTGFGWTNAVFEYFCQKYIGVDEK